MRHSVAQKVKPHVERDRTPIDDHVTPVEMTQQHGDDQHQFDDGRRELQQHHAHDGFDGVAAALQHARQPAGLALEMKAQRQQVHVLEGEIASRRTAFIATLAKMPSRHWVSSAMTMRMPP